MINTENTNRLKLSGISYLQLKLAGLNVLKAIHFI